MSCVAQLQCHVKVKRIHVYLFGAGVIQFEVTGIFQLLKGLFYILLIHYRFNDYNE